MSSAKQGLRRVGIGGLAALVGSTVAGLALAAPANATLAPGNGQIGIVDTDTTAANQTQGATLVEPGQNDQSVADIALLIPAQFDAGDTIDLALFDRTATTTQKGQTNADAAHSLGWSGTPTVTVDTTPYTAATDIGPTAGANPPGPNNGDVLNGLGGPHAQLLIPNPPPQFTPSLVSSSRATGTGAKDVLRLTLNNQDLGPADPNGKWLVKISGLKLNVGAETSPGAVRVIPFAYNGAPATDFSNKVGLFQGNVADTDNNPATWDPTINTYTVPAFIDPVNWSVAAPTSIQADGAAQHIGDISIAENTTYSLQPGNYRVVVNGANVANTASDPITATITGGAVVTVGPVTFHETVSSPATVVGNTIQFTIGDDGPLANQNDRTKATIKLSGVLLSTNAAGEISYRLRGGSIDGNGTANFLGELAGDATAVGTNPDIATPFGLHGEPAESAILSGGDVNQQDIVPPALIHTGQATSGNLRVGGIDRYATAAKAALSFAGCATTCPNVNHPQLNSVVLASGENFPDALSGNYLATSQGTAILLTQKNALPQVTADAICELGAQRIFIIGGTAVVSTAQENALKNTLQHNSGCSGTPNGGDATLQVTRLAGADRYKTNRVVDEYAAANNINASSVGLTNITFGVPAKRTAFVATGENFPDALASGPATFFGNFPVVLTPGAALGSDAAAVLSDLGIQQAVIVGGTTAVSSAVESSITSGGAAVKRIAGADRFETATKLADFEITPAAATSSSEGGLGFDGTSPANNSQRAWLSTGLNYADALAGGPLAGQTGGIGGPSPILLTTPTPLSPVTQTWLSDHAATYRNVQALGLAQAVSDAALTAANVAVSAS